MLMFVGEACGKAEEAVTFYASVFPDSKLGRVLRYATGEEPDREGTIKHAVFTLAGQVFAAMDSAREHGFTFNEAISFMVGCDDVRMARVLGRAPVRQRRGSPPLPGPDVTSPPS